jgi:HK97 family phage portal protein
LHHDLPVETAEERTARIESLEHRRAARRGETRDLTKATVPDVFFGGDGYALPVSPRGAIALADVLACVRRIADTAASLPLHVYRRSERGRERVREGTGELLFRPAPAVTQAAFVAHLMATMALHGEAVIGKYRDEDGDVAQLGLIDPSTVQVEVEGGIPFYGVPDPDTGVFEVLTERDIVHVKSMSLDGIRGLSPIRAAREAVAYSQTLSQLGVRFTRQGSRPSGVLSVPAGSGQEELLDSLREQFESRHGGAPNAGRVAVLSGEVTFSPLSMPLQDAEYIAQRELSTREICRIMGVPPWMVGGSTNDSLTYATVQEQARAFVTFSLGPMLHYVESALSLDVELFPPETRTYAAFELEGLLRGSPGDRASFYTAALDPERGWMTRAEVRVREDLPAEEGVTQ